MASTTAASNKKNGVNGLLNVRNGIIALLVLVTLWSYSVNNVTTTAVLASTIRQSTPLVLGAICGLLGERSGVINIGIEGQMLMSAFAGFLANVYIGNLGIFSLGMTLFLATLIGIAMGALLGAFLAFMSVTLKMDQIIGGTVINILALGLTSFFYQAGLTTQGKFQPIDLGFLADIPLIGPVLFNNPPITYATIIIVFVVNYALFHTRWGLRSRAIGEHPGAADTVGINVHRLRYLNVIIAGGIAGLAGAFLTLESVGSFERGMTNGRGFVALAVMLFGKRTPLGAWGAALLFGFATALQTQLQFGGEIQIPHQFIGMLPYLLTILVLAGFVGRTRDPKALGQVYETE
ncbi:MAG: ABC transporter permease [Anaerolineales bacterium]|nr:ABC transporter permease [Anaerolineales bacterium]